MATSPKTTSVACRICLYSVGPCPIVFGSRPEKCRAINQTTSRPAVSARNVGLSESLVKADLLTCGWTRCTPIAAQTRAMTSVTASRLAYRWPQPRRFPRTAAAALSSGAWTDAASSAGSAGGATG